MQLLLTIQQQCTAYKINPCKVNEIALTKSTESMISSHFNGPGALIVAKIITKNRNFLNFMSVLTIVLHIQSHKDDIDCFLENELGKRILVVIVFVFSACQFRNTRMYQFVKYQGIESIAYILSSLNAFDINILETRGIISGIITILSAMPSIYADSSRNMVYTVCMPHLIRILQGIVFLIPLIGKIYFKIQNNEINDEEIEKKFESSNKDNIERIYNVMMGNIRHVLFLGHAGVCRLWKQEFCRFGNNYQSDNCLEKLLQLFQNILQLNSEIFGCGVFHAMSIIIGDPNDEALAMKTIKLASPYVVVILKNIPFLNFVFKQYNQTVVIFFPVCA